MSIIYTCSAINTCELCHWDGAICTLYETWTCSTICSGWIFGSSIDCATDAI